MKKKISLVLLAVLAVLFSIYGSVVNNAMPYKGIASGHSIANNDLRHGIPRAITLGREERRKVKNAMRIKARDEGAAMYFPVNWQPVAQVSYFTKAFYCNCSTAVFSHHFSWHNLRGPPSVC